jgi:hypothetical protein
MSSVEAGCIMGKINQASAVFETKNLKQGPVFGVQ